MSYSAARRQAEERRRLERERERREQALAARQRAEAQERERLASRSAGVLAELDSSLEYLAGAVSFAASAARHLASAQTAVETVRSAHERGDFRLAERSGLTVREQLRDIVTEVETETQRLSLRLATIEALGSGLRARGYDIGDPIAQADGTIALRARLANDAGVDLALVPATEDDELVLHRHDAVTHESIVASCPSLRELHEYLTANVASSGVLMGPLRWDEDLDEEVPRELPRVEGGDR